ncbi:MAG TPA: GNAT family N-acetyltransferase [Candidatus Binatia bacterium]|nr:GNAT family N-acetyltransferase [Candidatus Binatia bacterium]
MASSARPSGSSEIRLRPTQRADLDFVLALEQSPENAPYIGRWTRAEHLAAIAARDREHWLVAEGDRRAGYLIAYDLVAAGFGVYVKRIVVEAKSRGLGRAALTAFVEHARSALRSDVVWLTVFADNRRAQRSYAAAGFETPPLTAEHRRALRAAVDGFSDESLVLALAGRLPAHPAPSPP